MNWKGFRRKRFVILDVLSKYLHRGTEGNQEKPQSVRVAGVLAEIRTEHVPNKRLEIYL
jgi:hypothetical protein